VRITFQDPTCDRCERTVSVNDEGIIVDVWDGDEVAASWGQMHSEILDWTDEGEE
jgi:hypothetical protein